MFLLVKLFYACKSVGRLGKAARKRHFQIELGRGPGFFWRLHTITATASLRAEPAFPYVAKENTKLATGMRQSRMIHSIQWDAGPAGCTLLLRSAASDVTRVLVTVPRQRWDGRGVTGFAVKLLSHYCMALCISSRFASPTRLLSPSQTSLSPAIFHHCRRHRVFSSA